MGERKVLNKYFPPDFDPTQLPKRKRPKTNDMKVRMMLPMSVRCKTCGTFMYKGTKFNTRKEDVLGETYLGIQIYRFYYRCTCCAAEFTMKTDPQVPGRVWGSVGSLRLACNMCMRLADAGALGEGLHAPLGHTASCGSTSCHRGQQAGPCQLVPSAGQDERAGWRLLVAGDGVRSPDVA